MAYSYEVTPADGVNANFTIPFNYLIRAHIFVEVDGVSATFTFVDDYNITLDAVPTVGQLVRVMRVTPIDSAYIDFKDGSTLGESDLDLSAEHLLYCVQEAIDTVDSKLGSNSVLNWDALSKRIVNLADPVDDQDAATKIWVATTYAANVAAAAASAAAAALSETNAAASEASAAADAADAAVDAANCAADRIATAADVLTTAADVVSTNADVLTTNADAASTAADAIATAADAASTAADAIATAADKTATNADAIATAADAASTAADAAAAASSASAAAASASAAAASASAAAASATAAAASAYYDPAGGVAGVPADGQVVLAHVAARAFTLPINLVGSRGRALTAATAITTFEVKKNGALQGYVQFPAAGTTASFSLGTATSFAVGDILTIHAPATADATLADIAITLAASID